MDLTKLTLTELALLALVYEPNYEGRYLLTNGYQRYKEILEELNRRMDAE